MPKKKPVAFVSTVTFQIGYLLSMAMILLCVIIVKTGKSENGNIVCRGSPILFTRSVIGLFIFRVKHNFTFHFIVSWSLTSRSFHVHVHTVFKLNLTNKLGVDLYMIPESFSFGPSKHDKLKRDHLDFSVNMKTIWLFMMSGRPNNIYVILCKGVWGSLFAENEPSHSIH